MEARSKFQQRYGERNQHELEACGLQPQHLLGRREEYAKIA
jgi:hypothetical protein